MLAFLATIASVFAPERDAADIPVSPDAHDDQIALLDAQISNERQRQSSLLVRLDLARAEVARLTTEFDRLALPADDGGLDAVERRAAIRVEREAVNQSIGDLLDAQHFGQERLTELERQRQTVVWQRDEQTLARLSADQREAAVILDADAERFAKALRRWLELDAERSLMAHRLERRSERTVAGRTLTALSALIFGKAIPPTVSAFPSPIQLDSTAARERLTFVAATPTDEKN